MRRTVEREVKLVPCEGFRLSAFGAELPPREFTSTYHDTPGLRLARHGVALRHRVEGGTGLWQLKLPHGASRIELEEPGPPGRPPETMLALLPAFLRGESLARVARLRTRRQSVRVVGAEIVEDAVAVFDGARVVDRFRELEIELTDGDEAALGRLVEGLTGAGAQTVEFTPKLYRVLGLEYPGGPRADLRVETPLDALRAALADEYARLLAHDPGTRLGTDPEDLHQLRVATRRARAFLRTARPILDREWAASLRTELGWLGSTLGPARDLDVLLEHIRADVAAAGVDESEALSLVEALEQEHEAARRVAVEALSAARYLALLDHLEQVEPKPAAGVSVTLAELWWAEHERARKRFERLGPSTPDDELHAARIQVKRARYAAELAEPELGKPGRRYVAAAKRLQDVLGEHQDACVAEDRIRLWAAREPGAETIASRLLERERERRAHARGEWPEAWRELDRRGRKARP